MDPPNFQRPPGTSFLSLPRTSPAMEPSRQLLGAARCLAPKTEASFVTEAPGGASWRFRAWKPPFFRGRTANLLVSFRERLKEKGPMKSGDLETETLLFSLVAFIFFWGGRAGTTYLCGSTNFGISYGVPLLVIPGVYLDKSGS